MYHLVGLQGTPAYFLFSRIVIRNGRDTHCRIGTRAAWITQFPETKSDGSAYLRKKKTDEEAKHIYKWPSSSLNFCGAEHAELTNIGCANYHGTLSPFLTRVGRFWDKGEVDKKRSTRKKAFIEMTKQLANIINDKLIKKIHPLHSDAEELTETKQIIGKTTTPHGRRRLSVAVG